jgi:hypothetical protein
VPLIGADKVALDGNPFEGEPMTFTPPATGDTYGHGTTSAEQKRRGAPAHQAPSL